jgi:DNA-binding transcriptional ArsR family regulator
MRLAPESKETLKEYAGKAASLLKAMANQHRLMIMCTLLDKEMCVSELNAQVPLSQSALSQHLANLREQGLVSTRKEGQTVFYRVNGSEAGKLITVLHSIYCPNI